VLSVPPSPGLQTTRSSVSCPSASQKPPQRASQSPLARSAWRNVMRSAACLEGILTATAKCSRQYVLVASDGQSRRTSRTRACCARGKHRGLLDGRAGLPGMLRAEAMVTYGQRSG
jgi:hypothetical protein